MDSWQPIETAPKNEDAPVLLACGDKVIFGLWDKRGWNTWDRVPCWYDATSHGAAGFCKRVYPTHWCPLPAPPRAQVEST